MTWANKAAFFLILFVVIMTTLLYGGVHEPVLALFYVLTAAGVSLWLIDCYRTGIVRFNSTPLQLPLYAIAAYGFLQVLPFGTYSEAGLDSIPRTISLDPFSTELSALHFLALGLFFSLTLAVVDRAARIRRVVMVIVIFGFIFSFFAILQGVLSPTKIYGIYESQFAQPYGSFVNRHNFAAYMEMTVALPLGLLAAGAVKRDQRLLCLTALGLMAVALILSGSRGGLVALVSEVLLVIVIATPFRGAKYLVVRFALGAALLIAVVAGTLFVGGESSLMRLAETATSKDMTTNRTHIWAVSLDVIRNNLPFGAGLGAFGVAYTPTDDRSGLERVEQAHNDYLQTLSDAGIIGAIIGGAFLYFLVQTARQSVGRNNKFRRGVAVGAAAGIFAVLVHSIFDFVLHTTAVALLFLLLAALLVATGSQYDDDIHTSRPGRSGRKGSLHSLKRDL
jgi:O-antigen ligase